MAIPFHEPKQQPEANLQQQTMQMAQQQSLHYEEVDQVDGPALSNTPPNLPTPTTEHDVIAWKVLALAMCKALKDLYQHTMTSTEESSSTTAVIQIMPNGEVKPSWN